MQRKIVTLSISEKYLKKFEKLSKQENKTRSQLLRDLLDKYDIDKSWDQIREWGKETATKFNIRSEEDVLRIIND